MKNLLSNVPGGRLQVTETGEVAVAGNATGLLRPLLLLVFAYASAFNQDLSSWNVGKVTDMSGSESSVRSLLLLIIIVVGRGVLSSVYTSLSPHRSPSPSLSCCGVLPLLVSPPSLSSSPLTLVSFSPSSS